MATRLGTIARATPSLMADALFIHVAKIAGALQVTGFALYRGDLAVLHPAPGRAAYMANVTSGSGIQRDMVAWHAFYAGMGAVVAGQAIARPECRIVVQVSCTDKACIAPHVARFAIGNADGGCATVDHVDSLRHAACCRVCRIGVAITARNKRLVVYVIVIVEAVVICMAGIAVTDCQRIDEC